MSSREETLAGFAEQLRAAFAEVLQHAPQDELLDALAGTAVAVLDEDACNRYAEQVVDETHMKMVDFRNGMAMELEPARDMVAAWVGAARGMLGDAENYSETPVTMEVKVGESPETFAFTLQRVGKLTPHQARLRAEARVAELEAELEAFVNAPSLRHCLFPGCLREFDAMATMAGRAPARETWSGEGWVRVGAIDGHICPDHRAVVGSDHLPRWARKRSDTTPAVLGCACGWRSGPVRWRGAGRTSWQSHLLDLEHQR